MHRINGEPTLILSKSIALFIATRYDKCMSQTHKKRGRPKKADAKTAAERMRAYRKRKRDAGLTSVRRWEPAYGAAAGRYSDHRILDARSLAMHCKIVQKVSRDPGLLEKATANLLRWSAKFDEPEPRHIKEWQEILGQPWPAIADVLTRMNEDSIRLRSSSPFAGILSEKERDHIYAAFRA